MADSNAPDDDIIFKPKEATGKGEEGLTGMKSTSSASEQKHEPYDVSASDVNKMEELHDEIGEIKSSLEGTEVSNSSESAFKEDEGSKQSQADGAYEAASEVQEKSSDFEEREKKPMDASNGFISELGIKEADDQDSFEDKPKDILMKSDDNSKAIVQELDLSSVEVDPDSPEEQKPEERTETKALRISSCEVNPHGVAVDIQEDHEVKSEVTEIQNDERVSEAVEVIKEDETALPPLPEVSSEEGKASEPGEVVTEKKSETFTENVSINTVHEVLKVSSEGGNCLEGDESGEDAVNVEVVEGGFVHTSIDPAKPVKHSEITDFVNEMSCDEASEAESKELDILTEDSAALKGGGATSLEPLKDIIASVEPLDQSVEMIVPAEAKFVEEEKIVYREDEKISLKGASATSVKTPNDIPTIEKQLDRAVEKKNESSISETEATAVKNLVSNDEDMNVEAKETNLVDTFRDLTATEDFSEHIRTHEVTDVEEGSKGKALELTSKEFNISPGASEVSFHGDRVHAVDKDANESLAVDDSTLVEVPKDDIIIKDSYDLVIEGKKCESLTNKIETLADSELAVEEKDVVADAEGRNSIDAVTDLMKVIGSLEQEKDHDTSEILKAKSIKDDPNVASEELNSASEVSQVPFEGDKVFANFKKNESFKGGDATSVEVPKDITIKEELLDNATEEKKGDGSKSEMKAPPESTKWLATSEVSPDIEKVTVTSETVEDEKDESTKYFGAENEEIVKLKGQDPYASSDIENVKPIKGANNYESNILSKNTENQYVSDDTKCYGEETIFQPKEEAGADNTERYNNQDGTATVIICEEKYVLGDVSAASEIKEKLHESSEWNVSEMPREATKTFKLKEHMISVFKTEDLNDAEVKPTSENERKAEETPLASTYLNISENSNVFPKAQDVDNSNSLRGKAVHKFSAQITSEEPEKNDFDLSSATSIEVPVKELEPDSGFPEEQKSIESIETKESSSHLSTIVAIGEVVGSNLSEVKPSRVAEAVERKDSNLEVKSKRTSVETHEDFEKYESAQTHHDANNQGKHVNLEAVAKKLLDISGVPTALKFSSDQLKLSSSSEIVNKESYKESQELTSRSINIVPESSQVPSVGDEKNESFKVQDATNIEAPMVITTSDESLDQVIKERKSESSNSGTNALIITSKDFATSEVSPEPAKDIISLETVEKKYVTSKDCAFEGKKDGNFLDKENEVKDDEVFQKEELGAETEASEKSKDRDQITYSDNVHARLTKEATKQSNVFAKIKRALVKAKKAMLGKSSSSKTLSSEAKEKKNLN